MIRSLFSIFHRHHQKRVVKFISLYHTHSLTTKMNEEYKTTTNSDCCTSPHLQPYKLTYKWRPDPSLSLDENYMDIVMLLTRSVNFRQGSMGCIIVKSTVIAESRTSDNDFFDTIIAASTNQSLFHENDSDVHAEIATLGCCLQNGNTTIGCTIYITMPPCKRCFGALCVAGISRIVTSREYTQDMINVARERGIDLVTMGHNFVKQQKDRIGIFLSSIQFDTDDVGSVQHKRLLRKEDRRSKKKVNI
mmetsp:Transcript_4444/g.8547  ORF Transcript_4444/g.8547 Transcript_4444/m.8547 type:complete len:248 (+) Transcript_4444:50-793(+)